MFKLFACHKLKYSKGQIFPFLIALICVLIIMVMITVNLGQLGIAKTDVSNAADSAALSGASALSGTLLGLGLRSDKMCGRAVEAAIFILATVWAFPVGTIAAIIAYIVFLVEQWVNIQYARGEARMGWTSAKKTALQYAFSNAGIEEKKPTFEEFLKNAYGITEPSGLAPQRIKDYYDEYLKAESDKARRYAVSGFSKFIGDEVSGKGYWNKHLFGQVHPQHSSSTRIVQGYGWTDDGKNTYCNSGYYCNLKGGRTNYKARNPDATYIYDNWVEAELVGSITYGIDVFGPGQMLLGIPDCDFLDLGFPLNLVYGTICSTISTLIDTISSLFPMGIQFLGGNVADMTTRNPILVRVTRYRRSNDLGLWKFRYGEVTARAASHVFPEHGDEDICSPCSLNPDFDTARHLFESELTHAY